MTQGEFDIEGGAPVCVDELFHAVARGEAAFRVGARNGHRWCHLWCEDVQRLHVFAKRLGMKQAWFQDREGFPHYDLTPGRRAHAVKLGAVETDLGEWISGKRKESAQSPATTCGVGASIGREQVSTSVASLFPAADASQPSTISEEAWLFAMGVQG